MTRKNNKIADVIVAGTALTGAALGAAAVLLSDKRNQQKIKKTIVGVTDQAVAIGKSIKKKVESHTNKSAKKSATVKVVKKVKVKKTSVKKTASK